MSVRTVLSQTSRPYKIEIYGLQDNHIGTLQPYNDSFIGQVVEPLIEILDDGSQSFTCSIPKFYIDPETNLKVENPRWNDIKNGVLAENTRVLKVFMIQDDILRIYPFIIDGIEDTRDSHFSIYKKITASGMAFSELGKTGYKLELNSHTIESELEENKDLLPTINYWLDKVFPNRKDENGNIIEWLTPWCYEIRMDWSHYTAAERDSAKIYEDDYVSSWAVKEQNGMAAALVPAEKTIGLEKCRYINCTNSNKYNITQTLAETFGVFCVYEYKCNEHGKFISQYIDPNTKKVWQGRKVIFYNRAIKTDNPLYVDYQKNLSTIQRTADSAELYTKLFVKPIDSSIASSGLISIADTSVNPLLDEFILNFDYLYSKGSITEYQWNYINTYKANLRKFNLALQELSPTIEELTTGINDTKTKIAILQKEIESAQKTLTEYETLKNNEATSGSVTKDKNNTYSVVFVKEDNCYSASIRLQGIDVNSISGYEDYKYEKKAFSITEGSLIISSKKPSSITDNTNFYILLDEYGYPNEIYASLQNSKIYKGEDENPHTLFYLELTYTPANAYTSICSTLQDTITTKTKRKKTLEESVLKEDQKRLTEAEEKYASFSKDKEELNRKFELMMGPALREGYWTPEAYDDPGEGIVAEKKGFVLGEQDDSTYLVYDDTPFDEEELGYYYDNPQNMEIEDRKYYAYIPYDSIGLDEEDKPELLELYIYDAYTITASQNITPGWYFVLINGTKYFIDLTKKDAISQGSKLTITYTTSNLNNIALYCDDKYVTDFSTQTSVTNPPQLDNCSCKILRKRTLYNKAGYVYHFIRPKLNGDQIIPVLLLNDNTIAYNGYDSDEDKNNYTVRLAYNFTDSKVDNELLSKQMIVYPSAGGEANNYKIHYPRIILNSQNVNYESDLLSINTYSDEIYDEAEATRLEKFVDYTILLRGGKPYITLKITSNHTINDILNSRYHIYYQISRANEMLYLDAKEVAFENSRPRYSYSLSVANIPDENQVVELGQLVYINDYSLGVHAATGYISGITFALAKPQEDSLTIQNYKTKFEDLFSTITASSEAMKNNQASYNIAAAAFTGNGQIAGSVLQQSINNNNLSFNYSGTNVEISPTEGIILTNTTAYYNGVYGQIALRGGGIFLSDSIDGAGARIWNTAITPQGINASLITAGQLDTESIRIFAGNNMAFQWNGEGIFAYIKDAEGRPDLTSYVRYSENGLQYINGSHTVVDLGWNGLIIDTADGGVRLTGQRGLEIFHGEKTYVSLGRIKNSYGLQLYDANEEVSLSALNGGEIWLKKTIVVGEDKEDINGNKREYIAGISGEVSDENEANKSVRFWAGSLARNIAPFRVLQDGTLFASNANIEGTIKATSGTIGGWNIDESRIYSNGITLSASTESSSASVIVGTPGSDKYASLNGDGSFNAAGVNISGTINASGGSIGNLQIADVNILGGDTSKISIRITTFDSLAYKTGTTATITCKAEALRGNIPFEINHYIDGNYSLQWQISENGITWENYGDLVKIEREDDLIKIITIENIDNAYYINCKLVSLGENGGEPS